MLDKVKSCVGAALWLRLYVVGAEVSWNVSTVKNNKEINIKNVIGQVGFL
jgi:hypothetical protein